MAGKLLVANPAMGDPNFARTVVLVCAHDEDGALGLVLNRPLDEPLTDQFDPWATHVTPPAAFFRGGPVEKGVVLALGAGDDVPVEAWGLRVLPGLGLLDLGGEDRYGGLTAIRFFAGYSGWSAGQLEGEIAEHGWFVVDATRADPFHADPDELWKAVLRRQRGDLRLYASYPADPSLN